MSGIFPGNSSLIQQLDTNIILEDTFERHVAGGLFCDIELGLNIIRGDNIVLLGELDSDKERDQPHMKRVELEEVLEAEERLNEEGNTSTLEGKASSYDITVAMAEERKTVKLPDTDNTSLTCAARILAHECADANLEFMRCKQRDANPRACLVQGEKVTAAVLKTLREVETNCGETYSAYKKALKKNWHRIDETRKEQTALEECWRQYKGYNQTQEDK
ncbi:hypothetical protein JG687_00005510 [Phytophthora cactorum]|uniref:Uncharacterized protein n=2 Tax=Phytophthora cactorum TaxID=29920 RepID=A0A8T1UNK4_9STRA|nr:hypothetical protein JG687_00005510 [Phytophthora cactorum]